MVDDTVWQKMFVKEKKKDRSRGLVVKLDDRRNRCVCRVCGYYGGWAVVCGHVCFVFFYRRRGSDTRCSGSGGRANAKLDDRDPGPLDVLGRWTGGGPPLGKEVGLAAAVYTPNDVGAVRGRRSGRCSSGTCGSPKPRASSDGRGCVRTGGGMGMCAGAGCDGDAGSWNGRPNGIPGTG